MSRLQGFIALIIFGERLNMSLVTVITCGLGPVKARGSRLMGHN